MQKMIDIKGLNIRVSWVANATKKPEHGKPKKVMISTLKIPYLASWYKFIT